MPSKRKAKGFTIIELLVAVGVTALLVSLMLTIVVNVMGGWSKSSGVLTTGNQARLVLDQMSRDIQSAIIKPDGNVWMMASIQTAGPTIKIANSTGGYNAEWSNSKPAGVAADEYASTGSIYIPPLPVSATTPAANLESYRFGLAGTWLRFFSSVSDNGGAANDLGRISAPRAVSYQIVRAPIVQGSDEKRYIFFRSEVASDKTFTSGYNLASPAYNTLGAGADSYGTAAGTIRYPDSSSIIANNVIDFGVRMWVRTSSGLQLVFPAPNHRSFAAAGVPTAAQLADPTFVDLKDPSTGAVPDVRQYPEVVEVFLRVLTDEGAAQIKSLEDGAITGDWWTIALNNSQVFSRRIEIKGRGI